MQDITKKTKEERFREMAKDGIVCQSLDCPIRKHCLRSILKDYVPENTPVTTVVNLRNPKMQSADCPRYCPDEPLRMPIGLTHMYYDMPGHLERSIKNRLISIFSRFRVDGRTCLRRLRRRVSLVKGSYSSALSSCEEVSAFTGSEEDEGTVASASEEPEKL